MSILYEKEGHIVTITLNRPERLNAMSRQMVAELKEAWHTFRADDDARVAIVTGAGEKSFCAGVDLKEVAERSETWHREVFWQDHTYGFGGTLEEGMALWKPVIAAVNGYCIGGGFTLILGADIRICSENATFSFPEVKVGLPTITGAILLPRTVPLGWAAQLLLAGDTIDAQTALRIGLVNNVYPQADLMREARALAQRLADNAPLAVRVTKEVMIRGLDMPFERSFVMGEYLRRIARDTEDSREGPRAFKEKRKPRFQGR